MDDQGDRPNARTPQLDDLARICRSLNERGARYILIGGFAVVAHGLVRTTKDIDLLVDDSPENVSRLKEALGILADNAAAEISDEDIRNYEVVRVADEIVVDLIGRACGLTYADAAADAESLEIEGVAIPVASIPTLIRTKKTPRPGDAADREYLEKVLREKGP